MCAAYRKFETTHLLEKAVPSRSTTRRPPVRPTGAGGGARLAAQADGAASTSSNGTIALSVCRLPACLLACLFVGRSVWRSGELPGNPHSVCPGLVTAVPVTSHLASDCGIRVELPVPCSSSLHCAVPMQPELRGL